MERVRSLSQETHSFATASRTKVPNFLPHSSRFTREMLFICENSQMESKWLRFNHTRSIFSSFCSDLPHSLFFFLIFDESRAKQMIFSACLLVNFTKRFFFLFDTKWRMKREYYNFEINDAIEKKKNKTSIETGLTPLTIVRVLIGMLAWQNWS